MNTKTYAVVAFVLFFGLNIALSNQCDNFYAKVTYALNHTKKGMTATNFEHQMYYAERALDALEKGKEFMAECGCAKSMDKTLDAMETLDKAIEPVDWEAGRYFTKKAMGQINELITILDECTLGTSTTATIMDSADTTLEHEAYVDDKEDEQNSMEMEMAAIFDKHAKEKLMAAEKAIEQLVEFSKTIGNDSSGDESDPNSLASHQKAYLQEA
ncbi:MAG: hypothetical protein R2819_12120, partial [Allomuricauda sp.]